MKEQIIKAVATLLLFAIIALNAKETKTHEHHVVSDKIVLEQRTMLENNIDEKEFDYQLPIDTDFRNGVNDRIFNPAPEYSKINLCNNSFHKNDEHKGGEFNTYTGNEEKTKLSKTQVMECLIDMIEMKVR